MSFSSSEDSWKDGNNQIGRGKRYLVAAGIFFAVVLLQAQTIHKGIVLARQESARDNDVDVAVLPSTIHERSAAQEESLGLSPPMIVPFDITLNGTKSRLANHTPTESSARTNVAQVSPQVSLNNDEVHQNDEQPQFTFWSRARVARQHELSVAIRHDNGLLEAVSADFRQCRNNNRGAPPCPFHNHDVNISSLQLVIYLNASNVEQGKRPWLQKNVFAVTQYNQDTKESRLVLYEDQPNEGFQNNNKVMKVLCQGKTKCLRNCSYRQQKTNSSFPYLWDPTDDLCKSLNPVVLERYQSACNCKTTCFTPDATEDTERAIIWPWKSKSERASYHTFNETEKMLLQRRKKKAKVMRKSSYKHFSEYRPRFDCQNTTTSLTLPVYAAFQHHLFFIPQAKLIFCGIPKSGITEWIKFFRFVFGARDYLAFPHNKMDMEDFWVGKLSLEKASELLFDPTWTKAVFFREPAERLLSAYLDKVVGNGYTQKIFGSGENNKKILTFEEFVGIVTMPPIYINGTLDTQHAEMGLHATTDPHWRPQSMMCGLDHLLPHFDFVGNFNFMSEQTRLLLDQVGLWDEYGAKFDTARDGHYKGSNACVQTPLQDGDVGYNSSRVLPGFNQKGVTGRHSTGSKTKMAKYYTPELMDRVKKAYALDYAIFEELQSRSEKNVNDVATGKSLKVVHDYCSK